VVDRASKISSMHNLVAINKETQKVSAFLVYNLLRSGIEIYGYYSSSEYLSMFPNNGLLHVIQSNYLATKAVDVISYGYSSIQDGTKSDGLHNFKQRVGFSAIPIKRVFLINPKYQFIKNLGLEHILGLTLKLFPKNRQLKKAKGILKNID
jgi:hypothetical protein